VGGGSTNSVEDRGQRERGSGGGSPWSGVPLNLQMSETRILIRLLRVYFPRNWEFGSVLSKLRNFGWGGLNTPTPPHGTPPCSTVLIEKLPDPQLVKKFPAFYGTRRFITAFTSARHLSLS
jgi:hypothetical protein